MFKWMTRTRTPNYMSFQRLHKSPPWFSRDSIISYALLPSARLNIYCKPLSFHCFALEGREAELGEVGGAVDHKTGGGRQEAGHRAGRTPTGNSFGPISGLKPPMRHHARYWRVHCMTVLSPCCLPPHPQSQDHTTVAQRGAEHCRAMSGFKHQISQRQLAFLPVGRHTVNHISTDNRFNYWAALPQADI